MQFRLSNGVRAAENAAGGETRGDRGRTTGGTCHMAKLEFSLIRTALGGEEEEEEENPGYTHPVDLYP